MPVFLCGLGPLIATETKKAQKIPQSGHRIWIGGVHSCCPLLRSYLFHPSSAASCLQVPLLPRYLYFLEMSSNIGADQLSSFLWTLSVLPSHLFFILYVSLQYLEEHCTWYHQWPHSTGNHVGDSHCSPCPALSSLHSHLLPSCRLLAGVSLFTAIQFTGDSNYRTRPPELPTLNPCFSRLVLILQQPA